MADEEQILPERSSNDAVEINLSLLLKFQENIVIDLVEHDGFVVLGKGLGIIQIVSNLLHVLMQSTRNDDKRSLIMLINATDEENALINESLMEMLWNGSNNDANDDNDNNDKTIVNNKYMPQFSSIIGDSGTVDRRRDLYANGGIISVSNRVLVTDLLSHVVEPKSITGLIILHTENIAQYSMDRFVVNLYRKDNKWGFVKALSDDPEKCCKGFQPLQTKLKYLKLERSFLWPRFHIGVTESIKRKLKNSKGTKVTEVRIKMSDYMTKIQNSLMASIEIMIGELKRNNPDIASEYWSIENALDPNFVQSIIGTMNPVWHRISATTKKILTELSTLKSFLSDLFKYDSVTYYQNIKTFVNEHTQSMNNKDSLWLMIPEASATIACSKDRVYRKLHNNPNVNTNSTNNMLLEELPKWEQLLFILDEINEEKTKKEASCDGPTIIACKSRQTCYQLERVLSKYEIVEENGIKSYNFRSIMKRELQYQKWRKHAGSLMRKMNQELNDTEKNNDERTNDIVISKTFTRNNIRSTDRRRTRGGSVVARHNRLMNLAPTSDEEIQDQEDEEDTLEITGETANVLKNDEMEFFNSGLDDNIDDINNSQLKNVDYQLLDRDYEIIIITFDSIELDEILPSYIISYEPNLEFIRKVELYQSSLQQAKCFFMYYGESAEEQIYLSSIKHEKDAFTKLIREKANMPKYFSTEDDEKSKFEESFRDLNSNTRIAGGGLTSLKKSHKVIVDMRDFVSQLPFVCYLAGLEVVPAMLTVGDYILSEEICVERKAVRDLIESLENGRLSKQCESMFKWYSKPVLLIEFDEGKSFSFEPFTTGFLTGNSTRHVKNADLEKLQLRLAALVRSFPRLSILWSSSPFETARLFRELKDNQNEPDIEFAITAGMNDANSGSAFNEDALKFLRLIPGITDANSLLIIHKVDTLYDFCQLSLEDLSKIIGKENAQQAHKFLNKQYE